MREDVLRAGAGLLIVAVLYPMGSIGWHRAPASFTVASFLDPAVPSPRILGPWKVPGSWAVTLDKILFDFETAYDNATKSLPLSDGFPGKS